MINLEIPSDLEAIIGTEKIDFAVRAKRKKPIVLSRGITILGVFLTAKASALFVNYFGPLFRGEKTHFTINGDVTNGSLENLQPILIPILAVGFFVLLGILILSSGLYSLFKKGDYYIGTPTRFIHYYNGNFKTYDWEQFSGNLIINNNRGNIYLQLKTGKMHNTEHGPAHFVNDTIWIFGVTDILEIEGIIRRRIKEKDSTQINTYVMKVFTFILSS